MTMIELKKFNHDGMKSFKDFIELTRAHEYQTNGIKLNFPNLPYQNNLTITLDKKIYIDDDLKFHDKYEMAYYLKRQIGNFFKDANNYEMWTWLAAVYFDQFIRKRLVKRRVTSRFEHFIPYDYIQSHFPALIKSTVPLNYRHCTMTPAYLIENYEDDWCKYLLKDRMTLGDVMEHSFSNKANLRSKKLRELILNLYQDKKTFLAKPGSYNTPSDTGKSNVGKGGALRFNLIRNRIKKSYDIEVMDVKTIISKMGNEINSSKWVK